MDNNHALLFACVILLGKMKTHTRNPNHQFKLPAFDVQGSCIGGNPYMAANGIKNNGGWVMEQDYPYIRKLMLIPLLLLLLLLSIGISVSWCVLALFSSIIVVFTIVVILDICISVTGNRRICVTPQYPLVHRQFNYLTPKGHIRTSTRLAFASEPMLCQRCYSVCTILPILRVD